MNRRFFHVPAVIVWVVLLWSLNIQAQTPNARDPFINDYARVLEQEVESNLRTRLEIHKQHNGVQIIVLTIDNYGYQNDEGSTWHQFGQSIFDSWRNNGTLDDSGILVIADKNTNQINIFISESYPSFYQDLAANIINNKSKNSATTAEFSSVIVQSTEKIIDITITEVGFFQWHKWEFLTGFYLLFSLFIAFVIRNNQNAPLPLLLIGIFGVFVIATYNAVFNTGSYKRANYRGRT